MKLVKAGEGGVLAAILPAGMRAISTRIKEETGVGRLILPNDRVDVILTRARGRAGGDEFDSDTLFRNIRVLAIGQLIEAKDGKKLAEGNTATLELTPPQAQRLAAANSEGEISLSLRSIADMETKDGPTADQSAAIPSGYQVRSEVAERMASTELSAPETGPARRLATMRMILRGVAGALLLAVIGMAMGDDAPRRRSAGRDAEDLSITNVGAAHSGRGNFPLAKRVHAGPGQVAARAVSLRAQGRAGRRP